MTGHGARGSLYDRIRHEYYKVNVGSEGGMGIYPRTAEGRAVGGLHGALPDAGPLRYMAFVAGIALRNKVNKRRLVACVDRWAVPDEGGRVGVSFTHIVEFDEGGDDALDFATLIAAFGQARADTERVDRLRMFVASAARRKTADVVERELGEFQLTERAIVRASDTAASFCALTGSLDPSFALDSDNVVFEAPWDGQFSFAAVTTALARGKGPFHVHYGQPDRRPEGPHGTDKADVVCSSREVSGMEAIRLRDVMEIQPRRPSIWAGYAKSPVPDGAASALGAPTPPSRSPVSRPVAGRASAGRAWIGLVIPSMLCGSIALFMMVPQLYRDDIGWQWAAVSRRQALIAALIALIVAARRIVFGLSPEWGRLRERLDREFAKVSRLDAAVGGHEERIRAAEQSMGQSVERHKRMAVQLACAYIALDRSNPDTAYRFYASAIDTVPQPEIVRVLIDQATDELNRDAGARVRSVRVGRALDLLEATAPEAREQHLDAGRRLVSEITTALGERDPDLVSRAQELWLAAGAGA